MSDKTGNETPNKKKSFPKASISPASSGSANQVEQSDPSSSSEPTSSIKETITKNRYGAWLKLLNEKKNQEAHDLVTKFFKTKGKKMSGSQPCGLCPKDQAKDFSVTKLEDHILNMHVKYLHLPCPNCDKLFSTESHLKHHRSQPHKSGEPSQATPSNPLDAPSTSSATPTKKKRQNDQHPTSDRDGKRMKDDDDLLHSPAPAPKSTAAPSAPTPLDLLRQRAAAAGPPRTDDVHVGSTPMDTALWSFAASLEPKEEKINALKKRLKAFNDRFFNAWSTRLKTHSVFKAFDWKMKFEEVGSVRNGTHLDGCDFDVLVIINANPELALIVTTEPSSFLWGVDKNEVNRGEIGELAATFENALIDYFNAQNPKIFELSDAGSEHKLRFTIKTATPDGDLEFDILPVLRGNDGNFYLLNKTDGALMYTGNTLAANAIEQITKDLKDWNNLVRALKFVAKREAERNQELKAAKLPSCAFERAAMEWSERPLAQSSWKQHTFYNVFQDCLKIVQERLADPSKPLPPPNDFTSDVLEKIRPHKQHAVAVKSFLDKWLAFPEEDLLQKLKDLKTEGGNKAK